MIPFAVFACWLEFAVAIAAGNDRVRQHLPAEWTRCLEASGSRLDVVSLQRCSHCHRVCVAQMHRSAIRHFVRA